MNFYKYHALGNDYIVLDPAEVGEDLTRNQIRTICHRNYGIGSDGILLGPLTAEKGEMSLRIFNPDGSEAEKSGNGLRIFTRYLWEQQNGRQQKFTIKTLGGLVQAEVHANGKIISVAMGQVSFDSQRIPVAGPKREVLNEVMQVQGETLSFSAATIGNPHCVILREQISPEETCKLGPLIERDPRFPNRTNVQFMKILDRNNIQIEIWERGAGYTLASGSSSCAAAAVAARLGFCDREIHVHMTGGIIEIVIGNGYHVTMIGSVTKIAEGIFSHEIFEEELKF
jgi:diaminopimelate epimerase